MSRASNLAGFSTNIQSAIPANLMVGVVTATTVSSGGSITAATLYGDGSGLSGITAGATLSAGSGSQRLVVTSLTTGTMTSAATDGDLAWDSDTNTLSATNISIAGTITYNDVTNVDSVGVITARSGIRVGSGQSIGSDGSAVVYYGDGSNLTGIAAGIVTAAASGGSITLNLSSAQDHKLTVSGITTITVSGGTEGESHTVRIVNSGIATVGFSTYFLFPSGSVPSLPTADGTINLISFTVHRVGAAGTQLLAGAGLNYQ